MAKIILATIALLVPASVAEATITTEKLVKNAAGNPWRCDFDHDGQYGPKQNRCVVRVVFRRNPAAAAQAERIVGCESQWDEKAKNRSSTASGLAQFLRSTWASNKYGRHNVFHPVWNILGMRELWLSAGKTWRPWSCARIVGV